MTTMQSPTDKSASAQEQNRQISVIVDANRGRLRLFLRRRLFDTDAVEEILQDVFVELVESFRLGQEVETIGAWLMTVARNRLTDRFRRAATRNEHEAVPPEAADGSSDWAALLRSDALGPETLLLQELLLDQLSAAIGELPAEQAEVFLAHEIEGRSFKAMAEELGVGVSTLLARKHRAVKFLRHRLEDLRQEIANPLER
jgi:RNA polymerase sigma factor (sigma-70 family)